TMMYCKPAQHKKWSLIVMVFSMLSWIGGLGGLVVGFVLSLIGAILGFRWKTSYARQDSQPSRRSREVSTLSNRYCFSCGREISSEHRFCPYCGKPLPE
ncbi:MAG: zinc-ribbon domain-containing protein, partial [Candidatus Bathyarchaeia archaeon]